MKDDVPSGLLQERQKATNRRSRARQTSRDHRHLEYAETWTMAHTRKGEGMMEEDSRARYLGGGRKKRVFQ